MFFQWKNKKVEISFRESVKLLEKHIDVVVNIDKNIQIERLMKRDNLNKKEALLRLNLQDDGEFADFIIENNGKIDALKQKVEDILDYLFNRK